MIMYFVCMYVRERMKAAVLAGTVAKVASTSITCLQNVCSYMHFPIVNDQ